MASCLSDVKVHLEIGQDSQCEKQSELVLLPFDGVWACLTMAEATDCGLNIVRGVNRMGRSTDFFLYDQA